MCTRAKKGKKELLINLSPVSSQPKTTELSLQSPSMPPKKFMNIYKPPVCIYYKKKIHNNFKPAIQSLIKHKQHLVEVNERLWSGLFKCAGHYTPTYSNILVLGSNFLCVCVCVYVSQSTA